MIIQGKYLPLHHRPRTEHYLAEGSVQDRTNYLNKDLLLSNERGTL